MRITFVIYSLEAGGAERVLTTIANCWAEKGWRVTILTFDDGKRPPFYPLHPGVVHRALGVATSSGSKLEGIRNNGKRIRTLRRSILRTRPQVVISFIDKTNVLTLLALLGTSVPVIVSERTDPHNRRIGRSWHLLRKWTYRGAKRIVVQSERAKEFFPERVQRRVRIIPNPVVLPQPASNVEAPRGASTSKIVMGLGRLNKVKGFDFLLKAFALVAPGHPDWDLEIWGEGPQRPVLETLIAQLGLQDRVRMPGVTRKPFCELSRADLFVLPSRFEGFPNALCEAMASGLPVVSFDCESGPREIIRDGVDGVLVPPQDLRALSAAMNRLMSNQVERRRLGERAQEIVARFGIEKVMRLWEDVVSEVTA